MARVQDMVHPKACIHIIDTMLRDCDDWRDPLGSVEWGPPAPVMRRRNGSRSWLAVNAGEEGE